MVECLLSFKDVTFSQNCTIKGTTNYPSVPIAPEGFLHPHWFLLFRDFASRSRNITLYLQGTWFNSWTSSRRLTG